MNEINDELLRQVSGGSDDSGFDLIYSLFNLYEGKCYKNPYHNNLIYKFVGLEGKFDGFENVIFVFDDIVITPTGEREVVCTHHCLDYETFRQLRSIDQ